jgi:Uma2 family endonuclease
MTTIAKPSPFSEFGGEPSEKLWTRAEYYQLADDGFFQNRRVELIEGRILEMPPQKLPHRTSLELADKFVRRVFSSGHRICVQMPFRAADGSDPEPDIAVIVGDDPRAASEHPSSALLVIEISDATLRHDRRKARLYSISGVPEYWIVNINDRTLELHRDPLPGGGSPEGPAYATVRVLAAEAKISPLAAPNISATVADLLP